MKLCYLCQEIKHESAFHKNASKKDGLREDCKACRRKHYDANRERILTYNKSWNADNQDRIRYHNEKRTSSVKGRAKQLYHGAKLRALNNNMAFELTEAYIELFLMIGVCQRTGIRFDLTPPLNGESNNAFAPSIDKINPFGDYTLDNIQIVVWAYNVGKHQMTDRDYITFCKIVAEKHK